MENYQKNFQALLAEYGAKAERLDAENRMKFIAWRDTLQAEFDAVTDWTEAAWDEFVAKAEKQWHELAIKVGD